MPAETVDVLELQIRSRAEDAAQQIENLATSVADFGKNVRRYISNLNDFSAALTAIADAASKLSNTRGLGKVLEKVAPVAAAMKAKTPVTKAAAMSAQTKEAQFRRAYADVFPSRAAQKGMYPGKIVRLANDSAMVMDPRDINKRSVSALSGRIRSQYGMDRYTKPAAMNELITKVRAGAGRYDGANQAWMTQDAQNALRELAEYVVASARPENDSDLIARIRSGGNASLSLGKLDKAQLKQADMSVSSLRALLRDAGIGYSATGTGSKAEDFGRYMDKEYGTILDLVSGLEAAYKKRNENFITEKGGAGGRDAAIEAVEKELLAEILDVEARNERIETAPDAKVPMEALRSAYEESQKTAEPEIKQEAEQAAVEIKEAVKETVKAETEAATGAFKGKSNAAEYAAIKEAARAADEQAERAKLEFALGDNTPALIAASRSRFNSAGLLDSWNQMFGQNIPGLADRGLAAGLIDEDTAQAMKDAAEGVEHISEAAKDATASMGELGDAMADVAEQAEDAEENCIGLRDVLKAAGSTIGNSFLGKLTGQLIRVAKMRGLRALVKNLAAGFKEGMNNLYGWSDAISGHFAGAMDTIATKAMYAKNSIATAFAPAIEALVPILSTVVNWIHAASNALAQFIALLTGQSSWTEATESAEKWGDAAKGAGGAAKKAAKEAKDLLADWDELNIIQSKTDDSTGGGGGGGGAGTNYADMFKENFQFDEWTKHFKEIQVIVAAIAAGIAAWTLVDKAAAFATQLGFAKETISSIKSILLEGLSGIVLLTISFSLANMAGKDIALNGLTTGNLLMGIGSAITGALGGYFLGGAIGKAAAAIAGVAIPHAGLIGAVAGLSIALIIGITSYFVQKGKSAYEKAKEWVTANAFEFDVDAKLNLVNVTVQTAIDARSKVRASLTSLNVPIKMIKLGINDKDTMTEFKTQLGDENSGLIHDMNEEAGAEKNLIKLFYTMNPKTDDEGNDTTAPSYLKESKSWDTITNWYQEKGAELGRLFVENEEGQIEISDVELAQKIIDQVENATAIAQQYLQMAELSVNIDVALSTGEDNKIIEAFEEYKEKIRKAAENTYKERLKGAESKVAFLRGIYEAETDVKKKEEYGKQLADAINIVKELSAPGAMAEWIESYVAKETEYGKGKLTEYYKEKYLQQGMNQWIKPNFGNGKWSQSQIDEEFNSGYTVDDALNQWLKNVIDGLPEGIRGWLEENANLKPEDFLTEEELQVVKDIRDRTRDHNLPEEGSSKEGLGIVEAPVSEIKSEVEDAGKVVDDIASTVEEAAEAVKENTKEDTPEQNPVVKELGETEKLISDYFTEVQDYYRSGDMTGLFEAEDRLNSAFYDKPETVAAIVDAVWDYAEAQTDNKWLESPEVPSELANILSTGISIDAATSGMALDSTMENIGNALSGQNDTTNSLLDKVASRMVDLLTATNNLANRPVQVNLGVSSLFGDYFGRSNAAYGKATNG